jgi:hypothetical protein
MITRPSSILPSIKQVLLPNKRECKIWSNTSKFIPEAIHTGVFVRWNHKVDVDKGLKQIKTKKIKYYDRENQRTFEFISNYLSLEQTQ